MPNDKRRGLIGVLLTGALLVALAFLYYIYHWKISSRQKPIVCGEPWNDFSGENALAYVRALVDFGPRPPASEGIQRARTYLRHELINCGWKVEEQPFEDSTPRGKVPLRQSDRHSWSEREQERSLSALFALRHQDF